jgi:hypothetical protein
MQRYADSLNALTTALNLMIEEGDTLVTAAIAHPLHLIETEILQRRTAIIVAQSTAPVITQ